MSVENDTLAALVAENFALKEILKEQKRRGIVVERTSGGGELVFGEHADLQGEYVNLLCELQERDEVVLRLERETTFLRKKCAELEEKLLANSGGIEKAPLNVLSIGDIARLSVPVIRDGKFTGESEFLLHLSLLVHKPKPGVIRDVTGLEVLVYACARSHIHRHLCVEALFGKIEIPDYHRDSEHLQTLQLQCVCDAPGGVVYRATVVTSELYALVDEYSWVGDYE